MTDKDQTQQPVQFTHMAIPGQIFQEFQEWLGTKPASETGRLFFLMTMAVPVYLNAPEEPAQPDPAPDPAPARRRR